MEIILASQSPRRKELLGWLVDEFTILPADIDETVRASDAPVDYVQAMAANKAELVAKDHRNALVIASDTIVATEKTILGKPTSRGDAFNTLKALGGRTHFVYTAVVMRRGEQMEKALASAEVTFYPLSDEEINRYLDTGDYADKAGSYGIQSLAGSFVEKINGDYYSIVGFPIGVVQQMLKKF